MGRSPGDDETLTAALRLCPKRGGLDNRPLMQPTVTHTIIPGFRVAIPDQAGVAMTNVELMADMGFRLVGGLGIFLGLSGFPNDI